jgi:Arc/MetJ-type ribon-helix-helix transcriptional regulator
MRTTITLDEDIAAALNEEVRRRPRASFKEVVNDVLRAGLQFRRQAEATPKFTVRARSMGVRRGVNYDDIGDLLEEVEGPLHR